MVNLIVSYFVFWFAPHRVASALAKKNASKFFLFLIWICAAVGSVALLLLASLLQMKVLEQNNAVLPNDAGRIVSSMFGIIFLGILVVCPIALWRGWKNGKAVKTK